MTKPNSKFIHFRHLATIFGGLILTVLAGFYFFNVSAQTETVEISKVETQNLTIGKLAFSSQDFGGSPTSLLYTANPDGSGRSFVPTSTLYPTEPAWSPDGTKLVFSHWQSPNDIYSVNPDGSGLTNLTNTSDTSISERSPSWSVTGKIAYVRNNQIWVMNENGSGQQAFPGITQNSPSDPVWSPDGTKLAFVTTNIIWIINADGTNLRQLTTGAGPSWSPDGTKLVFGRGGIIIINADGTNETTIAASGSNPSWSPDGVKIAYRFRNTNTDSGVYIMDSNGGSQVLVAADQIAFPRCCDRVFDNPTWQPVAQTSNTYTISGRVTNGGFPVVGATVDLSGPFKATTTTDAVGNYQFPNLPEGGYYTVSPSVPKYYFTPANRYFVNLASNQTANFEVMGVCNFGRCVRNGKVAFVAGGNIQTINPDGTGLLSIATDAQYTTLDWSPDGASILFTRSNEIYKMNADGSGQVNLTNNAARDYYPAYSPDGRTIVFTSDRDGNDEIYKLNADGSVVRLTNNSVQDIYPSFSPDGQKIIFVSGSPSQLYTMNPDGSNRQQVPAPPPNGVESYQRPSFSPDGSKILFTFIPGIGYPEIKSENPDGSNRASLALGLSGTYSPDGSKLAYVCCLTDNTYRLNVGGQILNAAGTGLYSVDWQPVIAPRPAQFDFDGDGKSDLSYFRPSNSVWTVLRSSNLSNWGPQWGLSTDVSVPADYDGDMKTDVAVWRPSNGNFYILNSLTNTVRIENFGLSGDIPTGGDWDGDGKADLAVYRDGAQGVFYYRGSMGNPQGNISSVVWGITGDKPVAGDYDGDGRADAAVYRNGNWYINQSSTNQLLGVNFGLANDKAVPADYDGDGKTDIAVFRNGVWYMLRSSLGFLAYQFGSTNDIPVPADYDGDGKTDTAIFRGGVWWILYSQNGTARANPFGNSADKPVPAMYIR